MNLAETVNRLKEYWGMLFPSAQWGPPMSIGHFGCLSMTRLTSRTRSLCLLRVCLRVRGESRVRICTNLMGLLIRSREKAVEKPFAHPQRAVLSAPATEVNGNC